MGNSEANKRAQLKKLETGRGIQYILNEACRILGNPLLAHDMEYKVISYSENVVSDDPIWCEFVETGTVGSERMEFYKFEGFFDTAANASKTTYLVSEKLEYPRLFGKLFNGDNIQVGCAVIVGGFKSFEPYDPELFEMVCDMISKELGEDEFFRKYGQDYQEKLINELAEGNIKDKELYSAHVESIYINLRSNLYLAVCHIPQSGSDHTRLEYYRDLFKQAQNEFKYSIYSNQILIIISTDDAALDVEKTLGGLIGLFDKHNIRAGISSRFDNLYELRKYYKEAADALKRAPADGSDGRVYLC